jgi:hypothetical protein
MWCALALVLLLDASGSVDDRAWDLQVQAHADALADPRIGALMERQGLTAVMVIGYDDVPDVLVPWRMVEKAEDAAAIAREVAGVRRPGEGSTQTGRAVAFAFQQMNAAPCEADRRIIDLVTDGQGDDAARLAQAREQAIEQDIRINVLAVQTQLGRGDAAGWAREHVATPGGFVLEAEGWRQFARALQRKIAFEVSGVAHDPVHP